MAREDSSAAAGRGSQPLELRSRRGCWTCRDKKVKCDEQRPRCNRCARLDRACDYRVRPRKPYARKKRNAASAPTNTQTHSTRRDHSSASSASPQSEGPPASSPKTATHEPTCPPWPYISEASLSPDCLRILSLSDYEAIRRFRSTISVEVDTRVLEHSGPAIIWIIAKQSPLVMHMVCAFGGQRQSYESSLALEQANVCRMKAMEHYSAALTLLADATQKTVQEATKLDEILACLWLMISYEQRFGDGCGVGLITHFQSAAFLLREQLQSIRGIMASALPGCHELSFPGPGSGLTLGSLSPLSCRIICWISHTDGCAAFHGIGGNFNRFLGSTTLQHHHHAISSRLRALVALHRQSNLVYRDIWGSSYPQDQILEDLEAAPLLHLQVETAQLRYLLSQLSTDNSQSIEEHGDSLAQMDRTIQDVRSRYSEYFDRACLLVFPTYEHQKRFVMSIRCTVPFFLAVFLCFHRIANPTGNANDEQRNALRDIMELACNTLNDEGEEAIARLAWPLFIAALESEDVVHQSWILDRYNHLQNRGENYRRAREAIRGALMERRLTGRAINAAEYLRRDGIDKFVI